jgi:hypothetical protein
LHIYAKNPTWASFHIKNDVETSHHLSHFATYTPTNMSSTASDTTGIPDRHSRTNTSLQTLQKDSEVLLGKFHQMVIDETKGWRNEEM